MNNITKIKRHHTTVIKRQLTLLPAKTYYVVTCSDCKYTAQTIHELTADQLREQHIENPYI